VKAVTLLSGGLDSTLAAYLVLQQGIELMGLSLVSVFHTNEGARGQELASVKAARFLGIPIELLHASEEMLELVRRPRYGYGSGVNPCVDCRISMLTRAREYMEKAGAGFVVTGEVVGQRPMSQRRDAIGLIDKRAELQGLVLRPLSARVLEPTIPETNGWVNRDAFLDITGRSRKVQMRMAAEFGITDYPTPAGGCLLTDPGFSRRMRDLLEHGEVTLDDVRSLKVGRHFRLDDRTKLVVGRNRDDNEKIKALARESDVLVWSADAPGPTALLRGDATEESVLIAAKLVARYSKTRGESRTVVGVLHPSEPPREVAIPHVDKAHIEGFRAI